MLRFGIVGLGGMGAAHAREVATRADAQVAALCDADPAAFERFGRRLPALVREAFERLPRYSTIDELLGREALDAVVIATPHTTHTAQVRAALERRVHVLCEKPLATTAADARTVMRLAQEQGVQLGIAYQRHGMPRFRKAREIAAAGTLGEIRLVTVLIAQDALAAFRPGAGWRADPALSGGGHFMDTGSHIVDIMLWLSGLEPEQVFAHIDTHGTLVDVLTALSIRFTSGAVGTFAATSLSAEPWREEFTFYGTEGVLAIRDGDLRYQTRGGDTILPRVAGREVRPVENFIAAIKGEVPEPQAPAICGLRVAQLTEAAYRSAQSGRPERVG